MKKNILLLFAIFSVSLASCSYQKNNTIKQDDVREGDEWVYGVHPDSSAQQLKNVYTEKPELENKANQLREKLFGDNGAITEGA